MPCVDDRHSVPSRCTNFHVCRNETEDEDDWMFDMQAQEAEEERRQDEERMAFLASQAAGAGARDGDGVDNRESWMIDQERQEAEEEARQEQERLEFLAAKKAAATATVKK